MRVSVQSNVPAPAQILSFRRGGGHAGQCPVCHFRYFAGPLFKCSADTGVDGRRAARRALREDAKMRACSGCTDVCVFYVKGSRPLPRKVLQCGRSPARAQAAPPPVVGKSQRRPGSDGVCHTVPNKETAADRPVILVGSRRCVYRLAGQTRDGVAPKAGRVRRPGPPCPPEICCCASGGDFVGRRRVAGVAGGPDGAVVDGDLSCALGDGTDARHGRPCHAARSCVLSDAAAPAPAAGAPAAGAPAPAPAPAPALAPASGALHVDGSHRRVHRHWCR